MFGKKSRIKKLEVKILRIKAKINALESLESVPVFTYLELCADLAGYESKLEEIKNSGRAGLKGG